MLAEKTIKKHVIILHAYSLMSVLQRKIVNVLLYTKNYQLIGWYITISLTIFKIASNKQYFSLSAKDTQNFELYFLPSMNEYQFWICCKYEQISRKFHTPLLLEHIKERFKNASLCILLCWEFKKYNVAYYFFSLTIPYII